MKKIPERDIKSESNLIGFKESERVSQEEGNRLNTVDVKIRSNRNY